MTPTEPFNNNGFLHVPQIINATHINALITSVNQLLSSQTYSEDILLEHNQPKKIGYMFNKGDIFLETLVNDRVLNLLCRHIEDPTQIVPSWEDMIVKMPYSNNAFRPHQDLPLQSLNSKVFSIALYLHDSTHNPVWFLPGSHHLGPQTKVQIDNIFTIQRHDFVAVPANAGDVVMHHAQTIHFSEENTSANPRYTWYLEFRTLRQLREDSPWDLEWILKRRTIFVYALEKFNPKKLKELAPDYNLLQPYLQQIQLKVPHVTATVDYDMQSPYYHF